MESGGFISDKTKRFALYFVILVIVSFCVGIVFHDINKNSLQDQLRQMDSLSTGVGLEQLKEAGFIDVTGVRAAENPEITRFLKTAAARREASLKTYFIENGDLFVKLFVYDPQFKLIRSWTYEPRKQAEDDPDKRFSITYKTIVKDGTVSIELIHVPNVSIPATQTFKNEILYTYHNPD